MDESVKPAYVFGYGLSYTTFEIAAPVMSKKEYKAGEYAILERNEDYWGEKPKVKEVKWRVMPDAQTILMALEKGEVDLLYGADGDQIDMDSYKKLESEGKYVTDMSGPVASRAILLNAHQDITGDKKVRQALQYAINKQAIVDGVLNGTEEVADTLMAKTVPYCDIKENEISTYLLQPNDILFARTGGTVGKSYLVQEVPEEAIYAGYLIRTRYSQWLCPQYLKFFMESELYWSQLRNGTIATAQPNCNGKTLGKMLLPIPPLSEQYRIFEKVNALFDYCNSI